MQVKDYIRLSNLTKNGAYVNTVSKTKAPIILQKFFSLMDVYPSDKVSVIQEFFKIMWVIIYEQTFLNNFIL